MFKRWAQLICYIECVVYDSKIGIGGVGIALLVSSLGINGETFFGFVAFLVSLTLAFILLAITGDKDDGKSRDDVVRLYNKRYKRVS